MFDDDMHKCLGMFKNSFILDISGEPRSLWRQESCLVSLVFVSMGTSFLTIMVVLSIF